MPLPWSVGGIEALGDHALHAETGRLREDSHDCDLPPGGLQDARRPQ
jgi:hypothetical protein